MEKKDILIAKDIFKALFYLIQNRTGLSQNKMISLLSCPPSTVKNILRKDDASLNAEVVISFCHKFGINVTDIYYPKVKIKEKCEYEKTSEYSSAVTSYAESLMSVKNTDTAYTCEESSVCHKLNDKSYFGTFYGYSYNSQYRGQLDSFVLNISEDENKAVRAELELTCYSTDGFNRETTRIKRLSGVPFHIEPDLIYIIFTQTDGNELYVFAYNHILINSGKKIFYRHGALLSTSRGSHIAPQIQSFIFSDKLIQENNLHYVKGILKLVQDSILVPEKAFTELVNTNEFVAECMKRNVLIHRKTEMCSFSENTLFDIGTDEGIDRRTLIEALAALREHSVNSQFFVFPDFGDKSKLYSKLILEIQQPDNVSE